MPCTDGRDSGLRIEYRDNPEQSNKIKYLTACLCAIFNELDKRGITTDVIQTASKDGGVNINDFWITHLQEDKDRILKQLRSTFTKHEMDLIKVMFK